MKKCCLARKFKASVKGEAHDEQSLPHDENDSLFLMRLFMSDPVSRTYCSVNKNAHCGDQLIIETVNTTCQFFDTENCTQFAATLVHNFDLVFRFRLLVLCKTIFKKTNMSSCFQSVWYVDAEASSDIKNQPKETPKKIKHLNSLICTGLALSGDVCHR